MKKHVILPLTALILGVVGYGLRRWQLSSAFEPETMMAIPGAPATYAVVIFTVLAVLVLAALCWKQPKGCYTSYDDAFYAPCPLYLSAVLLAALLTMAAGVWGILDFLVFRTDTQMVRLVLSVLCIAAGGCIAVLGWNNYRGNRQGKFSFLVLAPAYTSCLWLAVYYLSHTANPVVMEYAHPLLAIVGLVLGNYFMASFSFEAPKVFRTTFFGLLAVVFSVTAIANESDGLSLCLLLGGSIYLFCQITVLLYRGVHPRPLEGEPTALEDAS